MSHSVEIKTGFKSIETLTKALEKLNWKVKEKAKVRTYSTDPARNTVYDFVAVNPKSTGYDVGIKLVGDGYNLACDFMDHSIENQLGQKFGKLKAEYAVNTISDFYTDVLTEETEEFITITADDGM